MANFIYNVQVPKDFVYLYHKSERDLYRRMVLDMGMDTSIAMRVIALWLWMEESGRADVLELVGCLDDSALRSATAIACHFVDEILRRFPASGEVSPSPTFERAQCGQGSDSAARGVRYFLRAVCQKAFDDIIEEVEAARRNLTIDALVGKMSQASLSCNDQGTNKTRINFHGMQRPPARHEQTPQITSPVVVSNASAGRSIQPPATEMYDVWPYYGLPPTSYMRALEKRCEGGNGNEEKLNDDGCEEEDRMLFVTFSNGYPLTEDDLYKFFTRTYGEVKSVQLERVNKQGRICPLYACVTFYSVLTVYRILNGRGKAKFIYKGRHLWVRRYVNKKTYPVHHY